jgi:hypothetical protein
MLPARNDGWHIAVLARGDLLPALSVSRFYGWFFTCFECFSVVVVVNCGCFGIVITRDYEIPMDLSPTTFTLIGNLRMLFNVEWKVHIVF